MRAAERQYSRIRISKIRQKKKYVRITNFRICDLGENSCSSENTDFKVNKKLSYKRTTIKNKMKLQLKLLNMHL